MTSGSGEPFPGGLSRRVLKPDSHRRQFVADAVGLGKVSGLAGGGSFGDASLDSGVLHAGLEPRLRMMPEHAE